MWEVCLILIDSVIADSRAYSWMKSTFPLTFLLIYLDVGDPGSHDQVPIACKDAVAILFMFDLTSRSTLNRCAYNSLFFSVKNSSE